MKSKGNRTRQHIIEKCMQLFSVKGYFNTSIDDILKATGLSRGGLYGHFRGKQDIWQAAYEQASNIWKNIIFKETINISDPLKRIQKVVENDMREYLGANVFEGGCFFLNMLVEFSGQAPALKKHVLKGFIAFSELLESWLNEANEKGILTPGLNCKEVSNFIMVSLNGAAALYAATKDSAIWNQTLNQLKFYIDKLRR